LPTTGAALSPPGSAFCGSAARLSATASGCARSQKRFDAEWSSSELYNSAWEKTGLRALTDAEIDISPNAEAIVEPDLVIFAERGSEVVGFAVSLPDFNLALLHNRSGRCSRAFSKCCGTRARFTRSRHAVGVIPGFAAAPSTRAVHRTWENSSSMDASGGAG